MENKMKYLVPPAVLSVVAAAMLVGPPQALAEPGFQLPFPCNQSWRLDTWGHAPALDMVKEPNQRGTEGAPLVASADGVVKQSFFHRNAGNMIQIDHGGRWFTTHLHLQSRAVEVGNHVRRGQVIGKVGKTGPTANGHPHLHYEQAYDANGDGKASWGAANTERVRPVFNGVQYGQRNNQTSRNVTSRNC
jgi:Peptidase family M23